MVVVFGARHEINVTTTAILNSPVSTLREAIDALPTALSMGSIDRCGPRDRRFECQSAVQVERRAVEIQGGRENEEWALAPWL